jgi:hypothetical protein
MKRNLFAATLFLSGSLLCTPARGDDAAVAAALQQAEERYKALSARVEDLEIAVQSYKQQVTKLIEELRSLKDEQAKGTGSREFTGLKEDLDRLREAIKEVDQKRLADQKDITAALKDLGKDLKRSIQSGVSPTPRPVEPAPPRNGSLPSSPPKSGGTNGQQTGYEYTIRSGDTLLGIVNALKAQGIKITLEQLSEANPGVKSTNLRIGQKIFIPAPVQ